MDKQLRILHLEDQPDFSALVSALLDKEGLDAKLELVTDFTSFTTALENDSFDLILADYSLPTCNGMQALQAARQRCPEVPFLLLSGAIGEHGAVDILQSGATDYVLKSGLERLVPAIRRAVQESRGRSLLKQAEAEARVSERQYHLIFNGSPVPMWVSDLQTGTFLEVNEAAIRHYGYSREEFLARTTKDLCLPDELARLARYVAEVASKRPDTEIGRAGLCHHRRKDGTFIEVDITWSIILFQEREALLTMAHDVTVLRPATELLKKSEARLSAALRIARTGSWEMELTDLENIDRNQLHCPEETCRILGLQAGQAPAPSEFFFNPVHPEDLRRVKDVLRQAFRTKEPYDLEHRVLLPDGRQRVVRARAEFVLDGAGKPVQMRGIVMDITDRPRVEEPPSPPSKEEKPPARAAAAPRPTKPSKAGRKTSAARSKR